MNYNENIRKFYIPEEELMDEKKLNGLLAVAKFKSLSRAAEALNYTQPALTQMMNSLEKELGCCLLERNHIGTELTENGRRLLPYIRGAVRALERLRKEADQLQRSSHRLLRIGTYPSITQSWLSSVIRQFQNIYPDISIELHVGGYDIAPRLEAGNLDLAFLAEDVERDCNWIPLMKDPFFAVMPKSCPLADQESVTIEQLMAYPIILNDCHELEPLIQKYDIRESMHITSTDDASRVSFVEQGLCVAVLPGTSVAMHSDLIRTAPLIPAVHRTLGAVYPGKATKEIELFIRFVQQETGSDKFRLPENDRRPPSPDT